ncbi:MAG: ABC transporter substrate-binding protein [Gloeomargarita sp. SKYBB_i_bin120]|nr:ABC transporter substrate-binding protein [Gloeomargarita sp. SKYG98]MCS7291977.1 ABC transporter substrate-binding protein [Gloeomargarita sp. SKYB120]MDW8177537.1 ABC transporter substrate-binding protein [Gloeomargarita sp. SKYBB_i_bin120]
MKRGWWLLLLGLTACQAGGGAVKVGTLLPLSGDLAQFGPGMQDAASLLVKTVNECGGVNGQPVQLVSEDDQTQPTAGAAAMTKLVDVDRVAGVVGAAGSAVSGAAVDIAVRGQVVMISPASTSPVFTERAKKGELQGFWFRTAPPDSFQGQALAELMKKRGWQRVGILAINNDYGRGLAQATQQAMQQRGGQVVVTQFYEAQAASFDSEVRAVFGRNPQAVVLVGYPETGTVIIRSAFQQGFVPRIPLVLTDGMKEAKLAELVGKTPQGRWIIAGVVGTAPAAGGPGLQDFQKRYQQAFNREPNVFAPNTWDAAAVLVLAAQAAQSNQGAQIRDKIRAVANPPGVEVTDVCEGLRLLREGQDINFQGASSVVDFDPQGDVLGAYEIWTVNPDGTIKVLETITVQGS